MVKREDEAWEEVMILVKIIIRGECKESRAVKCLGGYQPAWIMGWVRKKQCDLKAAWRRDTTDPPFRLSYQKLMRKGVRK